MSERTMWEYLTKLPWMSDRTVWEYLKLPWMSDRTVRIS